MESEEEDGEAVPAEGCLDSWADAPLDNWCKGSRGSGECGEARFDDARLDDGRSFSPIGNLTSLETAPTPIERSEFFSSFGDTHKGDALMTAEESEEVNFDGDGYCHG